MTPRGQSYVKHENSAKNKSLQMKICLASFDWATDFITIGMTPLPFLCGNNSAQVAV